jgi:class 3 adenylate cyclase
MGSTLRSAVFAFSGILTLAINVVGYALTVGYAAIMLFELARAPRLEHTQVMLVIIRWLTPSIHTVSSWFGWEWPRTAGLNFAPLLLAFAAFAARSIAVSVVSNAAEDVSLRSSRRAAVAARTAPSAHAPAAGIRGAETEQERAALLKRYRELEDALKSSARKRCSFLSIDVVGSTQMKVGETATAIAATFQAYEEMVRRAFESHGIWKSAWTPDGVMACFLDRELAVRAAQQVLVSLGAFNAGQNRLKSPFKIRCGLNEGEVVIFEDSQLEKVSDHAIDIAGHMQKFAAENSLQVGQPFYEAMQDRDGFAATGNSVDDLETYEWKCEPESLVERAEVAIENIASRLLRR